MAKYVKVTDNTGRVPTSGYHSVEDDFKLPLSTENETFAFVDESVAYENHPALFGEEVEVVAAPKTVRKASK